MYACMRLRMHVRMHSRAYLRMIDKKKKGQLSLRRSLGKQNVKTKEVMC